MVDLLGPTKKSNSSTSSSQPRILLHLSSSLQESSAPTKKTSIHSIVALELFEKLNSSVSLAAVAEEKAFPPEKILIFKFGTY